MSNLTKKVVVLKHSRPIKKGFSNKNAVVKKKWKYTHTGLVEIGLTKDQIKDIEFRFLNQGRIKNNEVLDKTIHAYRMWFLFLKLALELEEQNTVMVLKKKKLIWDRTDIKQINWTRIVEKEIVKKIKVKRSKYKGWDLDEVLTKSFNVWWETHSHLFTDEICKVLDENSKISTDDKYLNLQIDTSLKLTDILTNIRQIINMKRKSNKGKVFDKNSKYSVSGSVHKDALLSKYNAIVLKLQNNLSNQEILEHKDGYIRRKYKVSRDYDYNKTYSRVVYGLLDTNGVNLGAKQLLVNVCDGMFMK